MKKAVIIISAIVIALVVAFFSFYFISTATKYTGEFSVTDFEEDIQNEHFQTDKNYGTVTDYKSAAVAGKNAVSERFENSEGGIFEWMRCDVQYDSANDAYYIRSYQIFPFVLGGAYDVIIKSDGTVLAILGEK